jgi:hypothetical protein
MGLNEERYERERKRRNLAIAAALLGLVVLFYFMTVVRVHW